MEIVTSLQQTYYWSYMNQKLHLIFFFVEKQYLEVKGVLLRSEYTLRTKIKFVQPEDATNIPVCPITTSHPVFNFTIGLRFRIQRASSSHESTIKYKRLDNNQVEVFKFTSGPSDRMVTDFKNRRH